MPRCGAPAPAGCAQTLAPANGYSRRQEVKELIASLETRYPDIKQKLFGSMQRYPLYGWNLHVEER